jgi:hypothetical protein
VAGEDDRPWLVVVTGAPGSGKTTLARELAAALRLPLVSRDAVRGGRLATEGMWSGELRTPVPREDAVESLVQIVETAASRRVSAVVEFVVVPDRADAWGRLQAACRCLVVLTRCADPAGRAEARDRRDPLLNRPEVLAALGLASIDDYVSGPGRRMLVAGMQTDLGLPTLTVTTDDGFDPPVDDVVEWVIDQTR